MATAQEIAVAYVSLVPSMRGVQGAIGREFAGVNADAGRVAASVGRSFSGSFAVAGKAAASMGASIVGAGKEFTRGFKTGSVDSVSAAFGALGKSGVGAVSGIVSQSKALSVGLGYVKAAASGVVRPITSFAEGFRSSAAAASVFTGSMGTLGGQVRSQVDAAGVAVSRLGGRITAPAQQFAAGFKAMNGGVQEFSGRMGNLGAVVGNALSPLVNAGRAMAPAFATIGAALTPALGAVSNFALQAVGFLAGIPGKIADLFRGPATAAVVAGTAAITVAMSKGLGRLNAIDTAKAKLRGLGYDGETTAVIMQNATAAVKGTAFGLGDAATTAAGAVAAGIKPGKQLESTLKTVANVAAATGRGMGEMGAVFNQVAAGGKAYTVQIKQVADAGLPIWQKLSEELGVTTDQVQKMASAGEIDFATFERAASAAAGNVALEMGTTLPGAINNARAAVSRFGANVWKGFDADDGTYTGIYSKLADLVRAFTNAMGPIEDLGSKIGDFLGRKLGPVLDHVTDSLNRFGEAGDSAGAKFKPLLNALGPAAAAFAALGAGGLAPLLAGLPVVGGMLGPLAGVLGAIGAPAGIATVGLLALSKVDPTQMAEGFLSISARLPEILGGIIEGATRVATEIIPSLVTGITTNLPVLVAGVADIVTQVVGALVELLPILIEGAVTLFAGLITALAEVLPALILALVEMIPVLIDALVSTIPALIEGAVTLFTALVEAIPIVLPPLLTGIVELIPQIVESLVSMIPVLIEGAVTLFTGIVEAIPIVFPPLLTGIVELIPQIVESLVSMIPVLIEGAVTLFTGLITAIPIVLPPLLTGIVELIPQIVESLIGMIPVLIEGAVTLFTGIVEAIPIVLPPLLTGIVELIPQIVESLISMIPVLIEGAVTLFTGIVKALPIIIPALIKAIVALGPVLVNALAELVPQMIQAGKDLLAGLARGLVDGVPQVLGAITDVGSQMLRELENFFGIASPSKVMAQIGGFLDAGLAGGITGGSAAVASVQGMAAQVMAPVNALKGEFTALSGVVAVQVAAIMVSVQSLIGLMSGGFRSQVTGELTAVANAFRTILPSAVAAAVAGMQLGMASFAVWASGTFRALMVGVLAAVAAAFKAMQVQVVASAVLTQAGLNTFNVWVGGAFRASLVNAVSAIRTAFLGVPPAVASSWAGMRASTAGPTNYVIGTVYMRGIRAAVNAISRAVGLSLSMPAVSSVAYASGGVLPGYTPGRDVHDFYNPQFGFLRLSGGEGILRPEVVRALGGAPTINAWNASRGHGVGRVGDRGYAQGGVLDFLRGGVGGAWSVATSGMDFLFRALADPAKTIRDLVVSPARNAVNGITGGEYGQKTGMSMVRVAEGLPAVFAREAAKLGTTGLPGAAAKALGVPYVWGGSSIPPGLDCSGLVFWALQQLGKRVPRLTAAGYQGVAQPVSQPRAGDLAFWGNPARHVAIMTGPGRMIHAPRPGAVVSHASLYGNPTFGRLSYDQGGWLMPGLTVVENKTGRPEPVFTGSEFDQLLGGRGIGTVNINMDVSELEDVQSMTDFAKRLDVKLMMAGVA